MTVCRVCQRELASEPPPDQEPICRICGEELLRFMHALTYRGASSIMGFIWYVLTISNPTWTPKDLFYTDDAKLVSTLSDHVERLKGHTVPCDKCNPRRWSKDIL